MFQLDEEESRKLDEWLKTRPDMPVGAIGGRYTYAFTPTGLGVATEVIDNCTKEKINLTDYGNW